MTEEKLAEIKRLACIAFDANEKLKAIGMRNSNVDPKIRREMAVESAILEAESVNARRALDAEINSA
jgi:hypothetical protein